MLAFDGRCQHDNFGGAARRECKPLPRRAPARERPKLSAKPPNFHAEARTMRFVGALCTEYPPDEYIPRQVSGPGLAERTREREQNRTPCKRHRNVRAAHHMTARVHDERPRFHDRFNLLEQTRSFLAMRNQPRRRRAQGKRGALDLRNQCRCTCLSRGPCGPRQRVARDLGAKASHCYSYNDQFVGGPRRGREGRRIEPGKRMLRLIEMPEQEKTSDLEMPRMRGIHPVAVFFKRRPRRGEHLRWPA